MPLFHSAKECAIAAQAMLRKDGVFVRSRLVRIIVLYVFDYLAVRGEIRAWQSLAIHWSRTHLRRRARESWMAKLARVYSPAARARVEARRKAAEARRRAYRRPVRLGRHRLFSLRELHEAQALERELKEAAGRAAEGDDMHRAQLRAVVLSKAIRACRPILFDDGLDLQGDAGDGTASPPPAEPPATGT